MPHVGITDHPFGTTQDIEREVLAAIGADLELAQATDEETLVAQIGRAHV